MLKEGTPRHAQITQWLRTLIKEGVYRSDEKLPSEHQLCEQFDVSRVTVRKAMQTLENEQMIYRSQGLGSFVCDERSRQSLVGLTDFVEDMRRAGLAASSKVIQMKTIPVPESIAPELKLDREEEVLRLDRLRMGDGRPIAFDVTWLPLSYEKLIETYDLETETIYSILEREFNIPVEKGCYRIEAVNAVSYLAGHLEVERGSALLLIDRLSMAADEKPVYYQKRYYRTDRMVYELTAERKSGTKGGNLPLREFTPVFRDSGT